MHSRRLEVASFFGFVDRNSNDMYEMPFGLDSKRQVHYQYQERKLQPKLKANVNSMGYIRQYHACTSSSSLHLTMSTFGLVAPSLNQKWQLIPIYVKLAL